MFRGRQNLLSVNLFIAAGYVGLFMAPWFLQLVIIDWSLGMITAQSGGLLRQGVPRVYQGGTEVRHCNRHPLEPLS